MKVLGITEEITQCDLCGKSELKATYAVEDDNGNTYYLGSTCIKNKFFLNDKEFKAKVKEGYNEALKAANAEYESSDEFNIPLLDNPFEFGTDEHDEFFDNQENIYKAKETKIEEIRTKYKIEKKHFKLSYRRYKL